MFRRDIYKALYINFLAINSYICHARQQFCRKQRWLVSHNIDIYDINKISIRLKSIQLIPKAVINILLMVSDW